MKKITALIPCYNEEAGIAAVIKAFPRAQLKLLGYAIDVIVIDNNSTDKTAQVARRAGARVIHEPKKGKGNAIRTGFANVPADTDYVVMLDGDDTYKASEVMRLVEPIDSGFAKVIIGSRMHGRIRLGSMKTLNRWGNRIYSRLVRTTYKVTVTDTLTGYFAWSREVVVALRPNLVSQGFAIEMEMITKMARLGYEIFSVPVSYDPRAGESSLNPIRDGARIMSMYVRNIAWKPAQITEAWPARELEPVRKTVPKRRSRTEAAFYETLKKDV
jgi:glycosyltransferase involved in cell wall biosynthesis